MTVKRAWFLKGRLAAGVLVSLALAGATGAATRIADKLVHFKLTNGVTVFVYPRTEAPLFAGMLYVDAGSAEENVAETGLAHVLEHMAFKGTPYIGTKDWNAERPVLAELDRIGAALNKARQRIPQDDAEVATLTKQMQDLERRASEFVVPNEYDRIMTRAGGQEVNATTDVDYTNYFMTMPANKLELWAMMESQRMVMPAWREFYKERDVVAEERRMRTEDTPIGKLYEEFMAAAFRAHPYRNPTIGWMPDIYNLTIERMDRFYKAWYVPENMVIILAGDVKADEAKATLQRYFGTIPARPSPAKATTVEAPQRGERRIQVGFEAQPQVLMGWKKPTFPDPDTYVFEVIQFLLRDNGRSSRLYERLVKKDQVCQSVQTFTGPGDKYPNMLMVHLETRAPHTAAEAEKAALAEVERLKTELVSSEELERTRNQIEAAFLRKLDTNMGFARELGYYYLASRDPNILDTLRERMLATTPEDVRRVAAKYLVADNRTVAELVTRASEDSAAPSTTAAKPTATAPGATAQTTSPAVPGPRPVDAVADDVRSTTTISPAHSSAAAGPSGDAHGPRAPESGVPGATPSAQPSTQPAPDSKGGAAGTRRERRR